MMSNTDMSASDAIERTKHRQEYNLSAATSREKYNVSSSKDYLNEKGYGYERFFGHIDTIYTPDKWLKGGVNLTDPWAKRNYNSNAYGNYYTNPFSFSYRNEKTLNYRAECQQPSG